jgi:hypothetical protein
MPRLPAALRLPLHAVTDRHGLSRFIAQTLRPAASAFDRTVHAYAFKCDERDFASALLERHTQLWLFRTNQAAACGDFLVVDCSAPDPARRDAWVIELKLGRPLRAGGTPHQLRNVRVAAEELALRGVLGEEPALTVLRGGREAVLRHFDT